MSTEAEDPNPRPFGRQWTSTNGPHTQRGLVSQCAWNLGLLARAECLAHTHCERGSRCPLFGLVLHLVLKHLAGTMNGFAVHFSELFSASLIRPWGALLPSSWLSVVAELMLLSHSGKARYLPDMSHLDPSFQGNELTGLNWELLPSPLPSPPSFPSAPTRPPTTPSFWSSGGTSWAREQLANSDFKILPRRSCCYCTVSQSCLTLCDPMDCSTPGFPVLRHLPELAQTHVHWVSDAIQPSCPLSSLSPNFNLPQHQVFF